MVSRISRVTITHQHQRTRLPEQRRPHQLVPMPVMVTAHQRLADLNNPRNIANRSRNGIGLF
jgi:hypothetical protein